MNFEQFIQASCECDKEWFQEQLATPNAEPDFVHVEVCEPPPVVSIVDTESPILTGGA